jgi:8-oxo-dGTP pyrophosphatase MutT (NUDIX family)
MVERHPRAAFASALVFPGGKVSALDRDPGLAELCDGTQGLAEASLALRIAAVREVFEESGLLLARRDGMSALLSGAEALAFAARRDHIADGTLPLADFLKRERLRLACDTLIPFAHWITPAPMPKRFDTHFFIAAAPVGQAGAHDGGELVASDWLTPEAVLGRRRDGSKLMFPTRMNLMKLSRSPTVAAAIEAARRSPIVTVEPIVVARGEQRFVTIPAEAGYGVTEEPWQHGQG